MFPILVSRAGLNQHMVIAYLFFLRLVTVGLGYQINNLGLTMKMFYGMHHDMIYHCIVAISRFTSDTFGTCTFLKSLF